MTVTVSFNAPQIQVDNGSTGVQLSQVILPYSIRKSEDFSQYLGGQMTLGQSDGIKLSDNTKDWERLGLAKIKNMVAGAEIYVPDPVISIPEDLPTSSAVEAPVSSAAAVVSSAADSATSSGATVASSSVEASASSAEAPVSSVAPVSSAESQVTTAPSESTTEA
ncbi:hypothetical protein [Weissella confusa]|uniref:hypothetical protein n=1 Tax=Weissella confusa TaxID=1583 RepID=UPI0010800574|nr:hypothetical protein [Weissella confusa]MBJ7654021.1 hypothetical protein [Weissella confusa]TGE42547.1 hypothetical protein C6P24_06335 [Weissella confusa]